MQTEKQSPREDTHPLYKGFPDGETARETLTDGFALMESEDRMVDRVGIHPSIAHQFALAFHDILDLDETRQGMGSLFGARVELDGSAPEGGFTLKSEEGRSLRFAPPFEEKRTAEGVPMMFGTDMVRPVDVAKLLDLGRAWGRRGDSIRMELNAKAYTGFRRFGGEILDIETRAVALKTGLMGTVYGVRVMISRSAPTTQIILRDDEGVLAIMETDKRANPAVKALSDRILRDGCPQEYAELVAGKMREAARAVLKQIAYDLSDDTLKETRALILKAALEELTRSFAQGRV